MPQGVCTSFAMKDWLTDLLLVCPMLIAGLQAAALRARSKLLLHTGIPCPGQHDYGKKQD